MQTITADPWADRDLKLKPRREPKLAKGECRTVDGCARAHEPGTRHRVGIALARLPDGREHVPGRCPDFYPDQYVLAATPGEAEAHVREELGLADGLYDLNVITLED